MLICQSAYKLDNFKTVHILKLTNTFNLSLLDGGTLIKTRQ